MSSALGKSTAISSPTQVGTTKSVREAARMHAVGIEASLMSWRRSQAVFDDYASFIESFTNLTNWTMPATPGLQVSGGACYSVGLTGGGSGANHAWPLGTTGVGRAVFVVNVNSAPGGNFILGVTSDTAGAIPTAGGTTARGIGFHNSAVNTFDAGVETQVYSTFSAGVWVVTVTADPIELSIVARKVDGSREARVQWARSAFAINNLYIFNGDTNALSGVSVARVGAKQGLATVAPRNAVEGVGATVQWTLQSGAGIRIVFPPGYDSRIPCPVVMVFHGNGSDEAHWAAAGSGGGGAGNANGFVVANAFTAAGFIVIGAAYRAGVSTWGSQNGLDAYLTAYRFLVANYAVGPLVFYGNSMGGIESLLSLADRRIPGVMAWIGTSPTGNLADNYNATFSATINSAYGISGDYAAKTAGHDPALMKGDAFRGLPMLFLAATDDTTVLKANNTDVIASLVSPHSPEVVVVPTTGGHSFDFTPYTAQIVAFARKYAGT
jgi:fermentation-respiration switch protein FrsA (DUF1100 family)